MSEVAWTESSVEWCKRCNGVTWGDRLCGCKLYHAWDPENGDEEDWSPRYAHGFEDAAELFAKRELEDDWGEPDDEGVAVHVRLGDVTRVFNVSVQLSYDYTVKEVSDE